MEGLIPFVYRAIVQYKNGGQPSLGVSSWFDDSSPSASYMRLPAGDSGRFLAQEIQLFSSSTTTTSAPSSAATQSPLRRSTSRRRT